MMYSDFMDLIELLKGTVVFVAVITVLTAIVASVYAVVKRSEAIDKRNEYISQLKDKYSGVERERLERIYDDIYRYAKFLDNGAYGNDKNPYPLGLTYIADIKYQLEKAGKKVGVVGGFSIELDYIEEDAKYLYNLLYK